MMESELHVLRLGPDDPGFSIAEHVEYQVFLEAGYTHEQDGALEEYAAYRRNSMFYVAVDPNREVMGVLRTIYAGNHIWPRESGERAPFKTINDCGLYLDRTLWLLECDPRAIVEVGTVAVPRQYRGQKTGVTSRLYHRLVKDALSSGMPYLIASLSDNLLRVYRGLFAFNDLGPAFDYMGSSTTPVSTDLRNLADHLLAAGETRHYRAIIQGIFHDTTAS